METNGKNLDSQHDALGCFLHRIADKWSMMVVGRLEFGPKRFGALQREVGGITQKMLTQTLRGLERDGIVHRKVYPEIPPKVEYSLTPLGQTLCEPFAALRNWTISHGSEIAAAQLEYDGRDGTP